MQKLTIDGEQRGLYESRDEALSALLAKTDSSIEQIQLTPDRLTAMMGSGQAFSDMGEEQEMVLRDVVNHHVPVGEIARESVASEMEMQYREQRRGEQPPADAVPWDSDNYEYQVRDWFDQHVNRIAFECVAEGVVESVEESVIDAVRDEMAALWKDLPHTLDDVSGLGMERGKQLWDEGYHTPIDLREANQEELADIVGMDATAARIKANVGGEDRVGQ